MSDNVVVERCEDIATVVLNRPQKLNALTKDMWARLGDVILGLSARRYACAVCPARRRRARLLTGQRHLGVRARAR